MSIRHRRFCRRWSAVEMMGQSAKVFSKWFSLTSSSQGQCFHFYLIFNYTRIYLTKISRFCNKNMKQNSLNVKNLEKNVIKNLNHTKICWKKYTCTRDIRVKNKCFSWLWYLLLLCNYNLPTLPVFTMQKYNLEVENSLGMTFFNFKSGNNQPGKIANFFF